MSETNVCHFNCSLIFFYRFAALLAEVIFRRFSGKAGRGGEWAFKKSKIPPPYLDKAKAVDSNLNKLKIEKFAAALEVLETLLSSEEEREDAEEKLRRAKEFVRNLLQTNPDR